MSSDGGRREPCPTYDWCPPDFWGDKKVARLSALERDAYRTLLDEAWMADGLERSDLAEIAEFRKIRPRDIARVVDLFFFEDSQGRLRNRRQEREREKLHKIRNAKRLGGVKGAQSRWHTHGSPNQEVSTDAPPLLSSSSPLPPLSRSAKPRATAGPPTDNEADLRRQVSDHFGARYQEAYDTPYAFQGAKDGKQLSALFKLARGDVALIQQRIDHAFADDWLREHGLDLAKIVGNWNRLAASGRPPDREPLSADERSRLMRQIRSGEPDLIAEAVRELERHGEQVPEVARAG